jgi:CDP-glucose 4,6-dehydratase
MKDLFQGAFNGRRILITGDTGFKGSWLSIWLHEMNAQVFGYSLPPKTERDNFVTTKLSDRITHLDGNVVDFENFLSFAAKIKPEIVFHLAAQPLVLQSYKDPRETFQTNLIGTVNFLEVVRSIPSIRVAINVTSDKCYENQNWVWGYRENDPMGGKDPYSSSKGCSELITASYLHSFFRSENSPCIASARAGNVIGGGDWAEDRIVPDFFRAHVKGESMIIRNPDHTRPWQHVLEPLSGYLQLASALWSEGKSYSGGWNFGPLDSNHYSVKELIEQSIVAFGKGSYSIPVAERKLHEAHLLKLDISKAMKMLEWKPALDFPKTVAFTVNGYQAEFDNSDIYSQRVLQIKEYTEIAGKQKIKWTR